MGLKAGLQILQQTGKAVANYADDAARVASTAGDDVARTVTTASDDVARYVKACGKRSILEIKPIKRNINIEGLRFAERPIGDTVNFTLNNFELTLKDITTKVFEKIYGTKPRSPKNLTILMENIRSGCGDDIEAISSRCNTILKNKIMARFLIQNKVNDVDFFIKNLDNLSDFYDQYGLDIGPNITTLLQVIDKESFALLKSCKKPAEIEKMAQQILYNLKTTSTKLGTKTKSKILDKYSDACQYFGVDSAHNIIQKIENQVYLTVMKCKEIGCIDSFPKGAGFSINDSWSMENCCNIIRKRGQFADLYDKPARITFYGKVFGQNGEEGAHTIGILYYPASKTLYVLDSLPNSFREVKEYQNILRKRIFEPMQDECKNIIFSNKAQQNLNEYSCNNWALANIEALQKALKEGKTIDSVEKLNEVLPDDINKILEEQYEYIGKSF